MTVVTEAVDRLRSLRRGIGPRKAVVVLSLTLAFGGLGWLLVARAGDDSGRAGTSTSAPPQATATVERRDLVEEELLQGTLGHGSTRAVVGQRGGTLTALRGEGRTVRRGQSFLDIDGEPTAYLMYGSTPAWREMRKGDEGTDVRQLQSNLVALGYDPYRTLGIDGAFGPATQAAVKRWEEARGVKGDGVVDFGEVVFLPGPRRIASHQVAVGQQIQPGAEALLTTSTARVVSVDLEVSKRSLVRKGERVEVELPDGGVVDGTIARLGAAAAGGDGESGTGEGDSGSDEATVRMTVALGGDPKGLALDQAPVTVRLSVRVKRRALSVPITALLARPGGGYAVELVRGTGTRLIPVQLGAFAGGYVELSRGSALTEGAEVVVAE